MIHDSMLYDPIQGQGHRGQKLRKWLISKSISSVGMQKTTGEL